jgi:hypothetical protein
VVEAEDRVAARIQLQTVQMAVVVEHVLDILDAHTLLNYYQTIYTYKLELVVPVGQDKL